MGEGRRGEEEEGKRPEAGEVGEGESEEMKGEGQDGGIH